MELVWLVVGIGVGWAIAQQFPGKPRSHHSTQSPDLRPVPESEVAKDEGRLRQTELAYYRLEEIAQYKGGFLARTSHELRSPLSGVIGMHQLVLENLCDSPEEERDCIAQANDSALKMVNVLDVIIDAAKLEHGTIKPNTQPVQLANLLQKVHRLVQLQAQNRNVRLHMASPDAELYVLADPQRLQQALVRLIDITIAAMAEGSIQVIVLPNSSDETVCIAIDQPLNRETWNNPDVWAQQQPTWKEVVYGDRLPEKRVIKELADVPFPSPGFSLLLAQILFQSMQGTVEVSSLAQQQGEDEGEIAPQTRIECILPQLTLDTD